MVRLGACKRGSVPAISYFGSAKLIYLTDPFPLYGLTGGPFNFYSDLKIPFRKQAVVTPIV